MTDLLEREQSLAPDIGEIDNQAGQFGVAADACGAMQRFGLAAGAVDPNAAALEVDQPAQLHAEGDPAVHPALLAGESLAGRADFNDETGQVRMKTRRSSALSASHCCYDS